MNRIGKYMSVVNLHGENLCDRISPEYLLSCVETFHREPAPVTVAAKAMLLE